jgi:hypothetical protein
MISRAAEGRGTSWGKPFLVRSRGIVQRAAYLLSPLTREDEEADNAAIVIITAGSPDGGKLLV